MSARLLLPLALSLALGACVPVMEEYDGYGYDGSSYTPGYGGYYGYEPPVTNREIYVVPERHHRQWRDDRWRRDSDYRDYRDDRRDRRDRRGDDHRTGDRPRPPPTVSAGDQPRHSTPMPRPREERRAPPAPDTTINLNH